jgi:glycosyl transferase family 25
MKIYIINLASAIKRKEFQKQQLAKLNLIDYEFFNAISSDDIDNKTHKKHYYDWQRPLRKTEFACYFSHKILWQKIIKNDQPALILEDDVLLSKYTPELLRNLSNKKGIDLINLENGGRKKFVSKSNIDIGCNSELLHLYQDRSGAAGYILWPEGAKKLIQCEKKQGIALADAHITSCYSLNAYQIEPTPIIQLDQCSYYKINNTHSEKVFSSTISHCNNPQGNLYFRMKRVYFQIKLGLRQLLLLTKSDRRYVKLKKEDFLQK